MSLDGICMDSVVDLGKRALEIPLQRCGTRFLVFETLEFPDQIELEFGADPHSEFKGDIFVGIRSAVAPRCRINTDGASLLYPFTGADLVTVQASLAFNYGEFAIIKPGVVDAFPNPEELDGVAVAQPVRNKKVTILGFDHVGQTDVVLILAGRNGDISTLYRNRATLDRFSHPDSPSGNPHRPAAGLA